MMLFYEAFYRVYFWLKRMARSEKTGFLKPKFKKLSDEYSYYFWLLLNRKYSKYFKNHPVKYGLNTKPRKEKYTVSFTSFPKRIEYVHLAVETLLRQSFKPDRIVLWLAREQFPDEVIPKSLEELKSRGLTVRFCDDLRSHKKYYYAFKEYPDDNIILVDDDMFYPRDMIKKLVKLHKKHHKDIICTSAQIIYPDLTAMPTEWVTAKNRGDYRSKDEVQAFTGAGSLFPPRWYTDEVFNLENIKKYAFTADDLWLKAMSLIAGVKTTKIKRYRAFYVDIDIKDNETLFSVNKQAGENLNNIVWQNLLDCYGIGDIQR